jgi:hypothetical protein
MHPLNLTVNSATFTAHHHHTCRCAWSEAAIKCHHEDEVLDCRLFGALQHKCESVPQCFYDLTFDRCLMKGAVLVF